MSKITNELNQCPFPMPEEANWQDAILVFPADTGIPPLYLVFNQPRDELGRFASSGEPKPTLQRPSLRSETKRQIEASASRDINGKFIDSKGNVIVDWHYGHKKGLENRRVIKAAEELNMTQQELNDFMNSRPDYYQIEDAKTNLSHVNEKAGNGELDKIIEAMEEFLDKGL